MRLEGTATVPSRSAGPLWEIQAAALVGLPGAPEGLSVWQVVRFRGRTCREASHERSSEIVVISIGVYVGLGLVFDGAIGYFQPQS